MIRNVSFVLLPLALAGTLATVALGDVINCPTFDAFGEPTGEFTPVDCDGSVKQDHIILPIDCTGDAPPASASEEEKFAFDCCCGGLYGSGGVNEFSSATPTGIRYMPSDLRTHFAGYLVSQNTGLVEAGDFTDRLGIEGTFRSKETHKLSLQATLLPRNFNAGIGAAMTPVAMHLHNEAGKELVSAVTVESAPDFNGNKVSGLNAFAAIYLDKGNEGSVLAFREDGPFFVAGNAIGTAGAAAATTAAATTRHGEIPRDNLTNDYFHVVEKVRQLNGNRSFRSDSFAVLCEVQVRVYWREKTRTGPTETIPSNTSGN